MSDNFPAAARSWPDYRAVWRWHFYAGMFSLPFVIVLALTGSLYLFRPQIETWNDRHYDNLEVTGPPATAAAQIQAALTAVPGATFKEYELPTASHNAARVILTHHGETVRVYVHPQTLEVLHQIPEEQRFMRQVRRIHGTLLLGDNGSYLVELAASWTMLMIMTGIFLWWPRQAKGLAGILYPRLRSGSRLFWRDLHGVTGIWISLFAIILIASGLPWSKFWGDYFKDVRKLTGTAVERQDWSTGSKREKTEESGEHAGHGGGSHQKTEPAATLDLTAVDRISASVQPLNLPAPVVIAPPRGKSSQWSVKSMTANRPQRVDLMVEGNTGEIVSRKNFEDRHMVDQVVGTGIAVHEGALFGWLNQALGVLTALGLVLLSVTGVVLWWRRRDHGVLGAPRVGLSPRISFGLLLLVILFAIYLPLFGASLLSVLIVERLILRHIPGVRHWLGLQGSSPQPAGP